MAEIVLDAQSVPSTPAANKVVIYPDSSLGLLSSRDEGGFTHRVNRITNFSTTSQVLTAGVASILTGSELLVASKFLTNALALRWRFSMTKTAAGTAASSISVRVGLSGTAVDTAVISFAKPGGTAAVDEGWVDIFVRTGYSTFVTVLNGECRMSHNLNATGHMTIPFFAVQSSGNLGVVQQPFIKFTVGITTGASDVITVQMVQSEAYNV